MITGGMVHIFTGEGRGKTSAALGTVMRAAGYGLKVFVLFFMKGIHPGGEYSSLQKLGVDFKVFGRPDFYGPSDIKNEDRELARAAFKASIEALNSGQYELVVLDEINTAAAWNLIETGDVLKLIDAKPHGVELILTGRYAAQAIIERSDYATELVSMKHPFNRGTPARQGIDY
jgi:cob(I)alamin adenosyltransferase